MTRRLNQAEPIRESLSKHPKPSRLGFAIILVFAMLLYLLMTNLPTGMSWLPYKCWAEKAPFSFFYRVLWFIGDFTEAQFHRNLLGSLGLWIFGCIGWYLHTKKSKYAGIPICYGTGLWPWVFAASTLSLILSNFVFDYVSILATDRGREIGWVPSFVPSVAMPVAVIFVYGGNWRNTLTGAVLGGLIACPISWFILDKFLFEWEISALVANATSMWLGGIMVLEICRYLPWMKRPEEKGLDPPGKLNIPAPSEKPAWFIRRVFADLTEGQFYGSEIACIGLLLGGVATWFLNPGHPAYGSHLFPHILLAQFIGISLGIYIYFDQWVAHGWYPTFVCAFSTSPAVVLAYEGTIQSIIWGGVIGAIFCPPIAQMIIRALPDGWHPLIANTFSMALCTLVTLITLKILPGFGMP